MRQHEATRAYVVLYEVHKNISFTGANYPLFSTIHRYPTLNSRFLRHEHKYVHVELIISSERYTNPLKEYCIAALSPTAKTARRCSSMLAIDLVTAKSVPTPTRSISFHFRLSRALYM